MIVMAVTGIHAGLTSESIGSVQASSGHGVTVTPGHPTAQLGQTVGEEPLDVTTTAAAGGKWWIAAGFFAFYFVMDFALVFAMMALFRQRGRHLVS